MKTVETVNVKQLASHELSVEQQLYFKEITEVNNKNNNRYSLRLIAYWDNWIVPIYNLKLGKLC